MKMIKKFATPVLLLFGTTLMLVLSAGFKPCYKHTAEVNAKDSVLIKNARAIIEYCNAADSVNLKSLLKIKTINNQPAGNSNFINLVWSFNEFGKKNNTIKDYFFEPVNQYCFSTFSGSYVLVVGEDAQVFEFNSTGKLTGFYTCVK